MFKLDKKIWSSCVSNQGQFKLFLFFKTSGESNVLIMTPDLAPELATRSPGDICQVLQLRAQTWGMSGPAGCSLPWLMTDHTLSRAKLQPSLHCIGSVLKLRNQVRRKNCKIIKRVPISHKPILLKQATLVLWLRKGLFLSEALLELSWSSLEALLKLSS